MAAWLAGLLLGEGTIYRWITTRRTKSGIRKDGPYPAFTIEMSDRAVMAWVSSLVGNASVKVNRKARKPPKYRTTYSVRATGARAMAIFEILMPFLTGEKRDQAISMVREFSWMWSRENIARLPKPLREFYQYLNEKRLNVNEPKPLFGPEVAQPGRSQLGSHKLPAVVVGFGRLVQPVQATETGVSSAQKRQGALEFRPSGPLHSLHPTSVLKYIPEVQGS